MSFTIPIVNVGEPVRHDTLSVFPLFIKARGNVEYILADEAIASGSAVVKEVSESGSVPDLFVENNNDERILFIEGDELIGAKQNRILNTSVLVAAHSKMKVPVSCVEQGRWQYRSRSFGYGDFHSPSKLRYTLKKSVAFSINAGLGHLADQGKIWGGVSDLHRARGIKSPTGAMSDAFVAMKRQIDEMSEKMHYVEGASGLAVAVGDTIVALDIFDKPTTCMKVWNRLLSGFLMDALGGGAEKAKNATIEDVERLLGQITETEWKKVETVGEGDEYRTDLGKDQGSILAIKDTLVHGSVLKAPK